MPKDEKTIFDLSDSDYNNYEQNPEDYEDVTENSNEDALNMMFPDGMDED